MDYVDCLIRERDNAKRESILLRAALVEIRDSTYRAAVVLRGMADFALTLIDSKGESK